MTGVDGNIKLTVFLFTTLTLSQKFTDDSRLLPFYILASIACIDLLFSFYRGLVARKYDFAVYE